LPSIPNADVKLTRLVIQGLKDRGLYDDPTKHRVDGKEVTYREQALIELKRYIEKGFASYFLIIRDLLEYSKSKDWDVGPGRGSAGGSLVCYLIGIHQLDPLKWGLSSVRFMGDSRGGHLLQVKME
jgi:DNA polymerase-3 subunit alpha